MSTTTPNYGWILPGVADPTDSDLWGGYLNSNLSDQDTVVKAISDSVGAPGSVPVACIMPFAGTVAPSDWALCYGQAISRVTYASLFTAIGTVYGTGDGSTTFNLPDLRGRVVAGKDDMGGTGASRLTGTSGGVQGTTLGAGGGNQQHTLITSEIPSHTHSITTWTQGGGSQGAKPLGALDSGSTQVATGSSGSAGSDGAHNNVQPTLILNYIIKLS